VSDEDAKLVSEYVDSMGISLPVGAGSTASKAYGVNGIPHSVLIDPQGKVAWSGHPSSLSSGTVKEALKGAKKRTASFLSVVLEKEPAGRLAAHAKTMAAGQPGKALAGLRTIVDDPKALGPEKTEAGEMIAAIEAHAKMLNDQAEAFVAARDVLTAVTVFEAIGKEFSGPIGDAAKQRVAAIKKDEKLSNEIAGAEALARAQEQAAKLGTTKAKAKFQDVVDKYKGTRAAERAASMLRGGKKS
jgi:hypothetical protein